MTITVRDATEADIEVIFDIRTCVRENHLSAGDLAEMGITPARVRDALAAAPCIWVAEVDGMPAGFSMANFDDGSVFAAFVRPEMEGRGVGTRLMKRAEGALFRRHACIWLETDGASRAAVFYRKIGWSLVATLPNGDIRFEKRAAESRD